MPEPTVDPVIPTADPLDVDPLKPETDEKSDEPFDRPEPHEVDAAEPPPSKGVLELVFGHGV
jgi:hypothetical protein